MATQQPREREKAVTRDPVAESPATPSAERGEPAAEHGQYGLVRKGSREAKGLTEEQIRGVKPKP